MSSKLDICGVDQVTKMHFNRMKLMPTKEEKDEYYFNNLNLAQMFSIATLENHKVHEAYNKINQYKDLTKNSTVYS